MTSREKLQPGAAEGIPLKKRHILAAVIGNALEYYDFLIYSMFAIQIGHALFPTSSAYASLMLSLATFGVGFVTRPIGAIVIGRYADRAGRRPAMMLCFALSGLSTLLIALIPTYAMIGVAAPLLAVLARMAQGFSVGGEAGSNTSFLLEAAPLRRRGLYVSFGAASQVFALLVGSIVGAIITANLPPAALESFGWRIAFLLGAAILPIGLWLRRSLPETLHLIEATAQPASETGKLTWIAHRRIMILGLIVLSCGTIQSYALTYIVTYTQTTLLMPVQSGFLAQLWASGLAVGTILLGGWLSDRIGRRAVNIAGQALFFVSIYPAFLWVTTARTEVALVVGIAAMKCFSSFRQGSFYATFAESFAKSIRTSGFGTIYAVSIAMFGGTAQMIITWLLHITGDALAPAYYLTGTAAISLIAISMIPESAPGHQRLERRHG